MARIYMRTTVRLASIRVVDQLFHEKLIPSRSSCINGSNDSAAGGGAEAMVDCMFASQSCKTNNYLVVQIVSRKPPLRATKRVSTLLDISVPAARLYSSGSLHLR
jgi:hypothetical protein